MDSYYKLPPDMATDIDIYEQEVQRFLAGTLPPTVFKAKRVPRGIYEQRRDGSYMVRVRVAGGTVSAQQALALSDISRELGNGKLNVTTRQDLQFHDIPIEITPTIMRRMLSVGLAAKGGGGNTVRNVMACPYAGICVGECFDVTPCAHAVTEYLLPLTGSYNLPRKYKIAFSGCNADCALAQVADLGFIAEIRDNQPGFRVYCGGGMGATSRVGDLLIEWLPVKEIIRVAETVRRLFDRYGDRSNKHKARLRYAFNRLGFATMKKNYAEIYEEVIRDGVPEWNFHVQVVKAFSVPNCEPPGFIAMEGVPVLQQRQKELVTLPLHLSLGVLNADDFAKLGQLAECYSLEKGLRTTKEQQLLIRSVLQKKLCELIEKIHQINPDLLKPKTIQNFVACAGASTCRLGICLSRNVAKACADALDKAVFKPHTLNIMKFKINGCTNACGQQPIAAVGFFGMAQRENGRLVPSYGITMGGTCDASGAKLGVNVGKITARAMPGFVCSLTADYEQNHRDNENFGKFFDRMGVAHFRAIADRYALKGAQMSDNPDLFIDIGADEEFSLAGRGAGECGSGVFEVIQEDLSVARKGQTAYEILLPTARALLITRGVDAQDPDAIFRAFETHFIDSGLVAPVFRDLLTRARGFLQGWQNALDDQLNAVVSLRDSIELLYGTLDANLVFHPPEEKANPVQVLTMTNEMENKMTEKNSQKEASNDQIDAQLDLGGVACPMNFVKAKMKLERMQAGERLELILDKGSPIENVPVSLKNEGHEVGEIKELGNGRWRVVIKKHD